jgi:hypothetical protein
MKLFFGTIAIGVAFVVAAPAATPPPVAPQLVIEFGYDHGGQDWDANTGLVAGEHFNIGICRIYKPTYLAGGSNNLIIRAKTILIDVEGALIATGRGNFGSGGGGGGGGADDETPGRGGGGGMAFGVAQPGANGRNGGGVTGGSGGAGGRGVGPWGGEGGQGGKGSSFPDENPAGGNAQNGGYYGGAGINADTSQDESVWPGSGGGGGGGGGGGHSRNSRSGGGGGGAGNPGGFGGGSIALYAEEQLVVYGEVLANGTQGTWGGSSGTGGRPYQAPDESGGAGRGADGSPARGGGSLGVYPKVEDLPLPDPTPGSGGSGATDRAGSQAGNRSGDGGSGGHGGIGAGGGILLHAPRVVIRQGASVKSIGAHSVDTQGKVTTPNGGTIKLFYCPEKSEINGRIVGGRVFESFCHVPAKFTSISAHTKVCSGDTVMVSAKLGVTRPFPTIAWTHDGVTLPGQTNLDLVLSSASDSDSGTYSCVANSGEALVSTTVTVLQPPTFVRSLPESAIQIDEGQDVTNLWVEVKGTPPFSFQWRLDGSLVPGGNQSVLPLSSARYKDGGIYSVTVSNQCGGLSSGPAVLQVFPRSFVTGAVWTDLNANGVWDTNLVSGINPDVVFVVDGSGSTSAGFAGTSVGDVNKDGSTNDVLDAELAGFIALNRNLESQGLGTNAKVAIIVFSSSATVLDMNFREPGTQSSATPSQDSNDNGIPDVVEILWSINRNSYGLGGSTDYRLALGKAGEVLDSFRVPGRDQSCVFVSDGVPNARDYQAQVASLRNQGVNLRAFGAGMAAELPPLQDIDPGARRFTTTDEILQAFGGLGGTDPEIAIPGSIVFVDRDEDGKLGPNDLWASTDEAGGFRLGPVPAGKYRVQLVPVAGYEQTLPIDRVFHEVVLPPSSTVAAVNIGLRTPDRFGSLRLRGGVFAFTYTGRRGISYQIQSTSDLRGWTTVTNIFGTNYGPHLLQLKTESMPRFLRAVGQ